MKLQHSCKKKRKKKGGFQVFVDPVFHRGSVILDYLQAENCQGIQRLFENENKQTAAACYANGGGKRTRFIFHLLMGVNWSLVRGEKGNVAHKAPAPESGKTFTVHFPRLLPLCRGLGSGPILPCPAPLCPGTPVPGLSTVVPGHRSPSKPLVHRRVSQSRGLERAMSYGSSCQQQSSK